MLHPDLRGVHRGHGHRGRYLVRPAGQAQGLRDRLRAGRRHGPGPARVRRQLDRRHHRHRRSWASATRYTPPSTSRYHRGAAQGRGPRQGPRASSTSPTPCRRCWPPSSPVASSASASAPRPSTWLPRPSASSAGSGGQVIKSLPDPSPRSVRQAADVPTERGEHVVPGQQPGLAGMHLQAAYGPPAPSGRAKCGTSVSRTVAATTTSGNARPATRRGRSPERTPGWAGGSAPDCGNCAGSPSTKGNGTIPAKKLARPTPSTPSSTWWTSRKQVQERDPRIRDRLGDLGRGTTSRVRVSSVTGANVTPRYPLRMGNGHNHGRSSGHAAGRADDPRACACVLLHGLGRRARAVGALLSGRWPSWPMPGTCSPTPLPWSGPSAASRTVSRTLRRRRRWPLRLPPRRDPRCPDQRGGAPRGVRATWRRAGVRRMADPVS